MKRIFVLALFALLGVVVTGRITLGEAGAMRYITTMENHMSQGNVDAVCDMLHADLEVNIQDHTGENGQDTRGGKQELCDLTRTVVEMMGKVPHTTNVNFNVSSVKRDWLHPWTSEIRYVEERSLTVAGVTLNTVSEDTITLVQTFSGVKLRKLEAEVFLAE
jgi:hypothetical protein